MMADTKKAVSLAVGYACNVMFLSISDPKENTEEIVVVVVFTVPFRRIAREKKTTKKKMNSSYF